jgi:multidrug efflux pump subunit AcrB
MWIVRLALRRPYTTAIFSLLILLMGALSVMRMPVDILPTIDIPVVSVVWTYNGLSAEEMERRVIRNTEQIYSTTVGGIEKGMSTTFLILSKQNDLDASKADELQANVGYAKAITALEQASGNLLEARGFAGPRLIF